MALLSFIGLDSGGNKTDYSFKAQMWGRTVIEPRKCSALEVAGDQESLRDPRCSEFNWIDYPGQNERSRFWIERDVPSIQSFGVYWGGELIRLCEIQDSVCRVLLDEIG